MEFLDARRLTGPSLIFDGPGSILDVSCSAEEADRLIPVWQSNVEQMVSELGWEKPEIASRKLLGGASMAFSAPIDALYAASAVNEWAWAASAHQLGSNIECPDYAQTVEDIRAAIAEEANPQLMQLIDDARHHGKTLLWDDDEVSVGLGRGAKTWPVREVPHELDWDSHHDVPIGLVTGTNGKTTTVRLATHIVRAHGLNVGLSSTDWIAVNDRVIERGDWSGPGGARAVLREQDVDVAILESARGGLLRRGLGVDRANAALITNIAEDHLGDFGSQNLDELLNIKWILSRAVRESGTLILNADDHLLRGKAPEFDGTLVWFSLDAHNDLIKSAVDTGDLCFFLEGDVLCMAEAGGKERICLASEIPITMDGAARHNISNSLAAAALTFCLGMPLDAIATGLKTMVQDENPGRCNIHDVGDVKVLIDFAHNPAAMNALFDMATAIPAHRRALCFGQAGDRPDALIREMTRDASAIGLDQVMISELAAYHRGREHGDVFAVISDELQQCGMSASQIGHHEEEIESFMAALDWAQPGDLVIMLALSGAAPIQERLRELGAVQSR
ncbi:MAG: Mur ligase [Gammaproteobacteria bacterium]|jgi:cyanophycin synthetase|nr:Mur ligase [Gammaproteobacteria bacterium]